MEKKYLCIFALLLMLGACKKNTYKITERQGIEDKSLIKVGLFNMTLAVTPLLIYNNGERISSAIPAPYPFPGGGFNTGGNSNGDYFALTPGANKFEFYTTNVGTVNLISEIFETTQNLEANKRYTLYIADTAANTVAILAPDEALAPDSGFARIRFTNLIPNSGSVDFYKGPTLLKSGIKYKEFTDFFDVPASTVDTFAIRIAGAASATKDTTSYRLVTNTNRRIYSFVARGYFGFPRTDTRRGPQISVSVNQ